jgi:CRP-like cAMP-binding protein
MNSIALAPISGSFVPGLTGGMQEAIKSDHSPCSAGLSVGQHKVAVPPSESLFFQGDEVENVYRLDMGWAFRYQILEDGRRQILDFLLPGDLVGFEASGAHVTYGVEAITSCSFTACRRKAFIAQLKGDPSRALDLIEVLCTSQGRFIDHLTSLGRRTARERVAHLIFELVRRLREAKGEVTKLSLPVIQQHLGDALGLASETVCRSLSQMKKDGILVLRAGELDILDIEALAQEAGVDRAA